MTKSDFHSRADAIESELDELLSPEELARIQEAERIVTHYSPTADPSGPRWVRMSVCGETTRIGDFSRAGSSNLEHVNCPACLAKVTP